MEAGLVILELQGLEDPWQDSAAELVVSLPYLTLLMR